MSAGRQHHRLIAEAETWLFDHKPRVITNLEAAMRYLEELVSAQTTLISERQAADQLAASEKTRADTAEAALAALQAEIAADEDKTKAALDAVNAEIAAETPPAAPAAPAPVVTQSGSTTIVVDPSVGTTTASNADDGTTHTVDHATGDVTAKHDDTGESAPIVPATATAAVQATTDAGVTLPQ